MEALNLLRNALETADPGGVRLAKPERSYDIEYAVWRFLNAWNQAPQFGPDHAVLLRQIIRWYGGDLYVPVFPFQGDESLRKAGVKYSAAGYLSASPFNPEWLNERAAETPFVVDEIPELRRPSEEIRAESYLQSLGYETWQSQAQKEAAWMALTAPPGSTSLIALPTGSGKSLCFQSLSRFGSGLTVVVVPTVALAIDQWRSAKEVLQAIPDLNPLYYASEDPQLPRESIIESVRNHGTRLVFTSPEACVTGGLRNVLDAAARAGHLENLVIDEAHIIESWGIHFRVDFQFLSMTREKWLAASGGSLRTFLLSATFTQQSRTVLRGLFGKGATWLEFVSQSLRPEMNYYATKFSSDTERDKAARECVWHLPRPAIVYTTEVAEAKEFARALQDEEGFARIACFHGETSSRDRSTLLKKWRNDEIDVMVATSAFGMGVDKQDVRAVVHACYPESMHRYYQEVGRGGRDGASSVCMLIPTERDRGVAGRLTPTLLGEPLMQQRWEALWGTRRRTEEGEYVWELNVNSRRIGLIGTRTWGENVRWNKRLLLQLRRAGKLELRDIAYKQTEDGGPPDEWIKVRLNFQPDAPDVARSILKERNEESAAAKVGLNQMEEYVEGKTPICKVLQRLYGPMLERVCGGCKYCRERGRALEYPMLGVDIDHTVLERVTVVFNFPHPQRRQNGFINYVQQAVGMNVRRFAGHESDYDKLLDTFRKAFRMNTPSLYRFDAIGREPEFNVLPHETVAVIHVDKLHPTALNFKRAGEVVHLVCEGINYTDANGRHIFESASNSRAFFEPDSWLLEV